MRSLKSTRQRQQARRLSRETYYPEEVLRGLMVRAETAGLSPDEVRDIVTAARRDNVPPLRALETTLDRRSAAALALASGELSVALGVGEDEVVARATLTDRPAGLHLGIVDPVVLERPGQRPLVVLRPRVSVDVGRFEAAEAAGEVSFELPPGRARDLVAAGECDVLVDPASLAGDPTRRAELLDGQLADLALDVAGLSPSRLPGKTTTIDKLVADLVGDPAERVVRAAAAAIGTTPAKLREAMHDATGGDFERFQQHGLREVVLDPIGSFARPLSDAVAREYAPGHVGRIAPPPTDHPEAEAEIPLDPEEEAL